MRRLFASLFLVAATLIPSILPAQIIRYGSPVPGEIKDLYEKGLGYLTKIQQQNGAFGDSGVTAICLMALIASGEDPNFGRYSKPVYKSIRYIMRQQDGATGHIRNGMYQHGFAMLALADVYGIIDEDALWKGESKPRSIGEALELAVRCALTSQKQNPFKAWRYSPKARDADTSVAGAVFMGLLAARNAGIEVPDKAIEDTLQYFTSMTSESGNVAYSGMGGFGDSLNRSSICCLVCAVAKRKDLKTFEYTLGYLKDSIELESRSYPFYFRYYMSQALFQGDYDSWKAWSENNTRRLRELQNADGSIGSGGGHGQGQSYSTGMALLSAALHYCFLPVYER